MGAWHGCCYRRLVGRLAQQAWADDALKSDDACDALEQIPVIHVEQLVHARGGLRRSRRERHARQGAVDIAQDRLRFVQAEVAVLQHRHPAERVARQVGGAARSARRHCDELAARLLLLKRAEHRASIRAARDAVNRDRRAHVCAPLETSLANSSMSLGQPLSTSLRIFSPPASPMRSKLRCSSSTRVLPAPSGEKRTSTSEASSARASGFHCGLICQLTTSRSPGCHTRTWPIVTSLPSSLRVYQRPPVNGSMIDCVGGVAPMPWVLGHQRSMPLVNTSKACCGVAATTTDLRTGAMLMVLFTFFSSCGSGCCAPPRS